MRLPLLSPVVPWLAGAMALLALALLWWPRRRQPRVLAGLMGASLVVAMVAGLLVDRVWHVFGHPIGWVVWQWLGFGLAAVSGALSPHPARRSTGRWRRALAGTTAAALVVGAGLLSVNHAYAMFRTPADLLPEHRTSLPPAPTRTGSPTRDRPADQWQPPKDLPATGTVSEVQIPGTVSGFQARDARVYLPPAYAAANRPQLPVLVLMSGQPGEPDLWFSMGHVDELMDRWAAQHHGLAPVVVVPDHLGADVNNPLCSDAHLGRNATYLEVDVIGWIMANLDVDPDTTRWAVAGLSNGGTCATQLATRRPDLFRTFASLSGELGPSLGDEQTTIDVGFGGDRDAYRANNPIDLMKSRRYPDTRAVFTAGEDDHDFLPWARQLGSAAAAAGMDTTVIPVPGGHDWTAWVAGLDKALPLITPRMGLP